jgi:Arc/MetJ family transcription regulator
MDCSSVKTTIEIPEQQLQDVMRLTGAKTAAEAVLKALHDFHRRESMAELVKFSGTCGSLMTQQELVCLRR